MLELLLAARFLIRIDATLRALLLLGSGLGVAGAAWMAGRAPGRGIAFPVSRRWVALAFLVVLAGATAVSAPRVARSLQRYSLDPKRSDIYPQVSINVDHLLSPDHRVYETHTVLGHPLFPTWLPAQWLPFVVTHALGIDHRWLPPVACGLAVLAVGLSDIRRHRPGPGLVVALAWLVIVPVTIIDHHRMVAGRTMELLLGAYYLLLGWALREERPRVLGGTLGLCLVSRYALAPWTPVLAATWWAAGRRRELLAVAGVALVVVVVLYGAPFLAPDPAIVVESFDAYTKALRLEWEKPEPISHLHNGFGLAGLVSDHTRGDVGARFDFARKLHLALSIGVALVLLPVAVAAARRTGEPGLPALATLKASLAVFFGFVPVPYPYLWVIPVMVSSQLLALVALPAPASPPRTSGA